MKIDAYIAARITRATNRAIKKKVLENHNLSIEFFDKSHEAFITLKYEQAEILGKVARSYSKKASNLAVTSGWLPFNKESL